MTEKIFDSIAYFKQLAAECRTCRDYNFVATECSGPDSIQGVMQQFRNFNSIKVQLELPISGALPLMPV